MLNQSEQEEFRQFLKKIGRNMRKLRKDRSETQEQASERIGLEMRYYQRLEHGDYPITTKNLFRIASRLGVEVKKLVS
jgi:transcriptional regulator with XRE-family HTH domain|tara:strand:- start:243 stop:476 length:234 start_codon:yes stop_codon:yes gene_type:complete